MPVNKEDDFNSGNISKKPLMSWKIEYVKERDFVWVVASGIYNIDDHIRMLKDLAARDFWTPGMNVLIDDSRLDFERINLEELREAALKRIELDAVIGDGKVAVLVKGIINFVRVRQYELITNGKIAAKISIFQDEEKALSWLLA